MTSPTDRKGAWFLTSTGRQFWPLDPRPEDVDILDIAHHTARICRFLGAVNVPHYSVAQHSILVSQIVPRRYALPGLLHDGHEAYCLDFPRPHKICLPEYRPFEQRVWVCVALKFNLPLEVPPEIHDADNIALITESRDLMPAFHWWPELDRYSPLPETIIPMSAPAAELAFLGRFYELSEMNRIEN